MVAGERGKQVIVTHQVWQVGGCGAGNDCDTMFRKKTASLLQFVNVHAAAVLEKYSCGGRRGVGFFFGGNCIKSEIFIQYNY